MDPKAGPDFRLGVEKLVQCYKNDYPESFIFLVKEEDSFPVFWGHNSLLKSDLMCMSILLEKRRDWKYFLNLAGTEYPTMNSSAMEHFIDDKLRGRSATVGVSMPEHLSERIKKIFVMMPKKNGG